MSRFVLMLLCKVNQFAPFLQSELNCSLPCKHSTKVLYTIPVHFDMIIVEVGMGKQRKQGYNPTPQVLDTT